MKHLHTSWDMKHLHPHTHAHILTHTETHIYYLTQKQAHTHTHTHTHVHTHTHTHTHTHKHTHVHSTRNGIVYIYLLQKMPRYSRLEILYLEGGSSGHLWTFRISQSNKVLVGHSGNTDMRALSRKLKDGSYFVRIGFERYTMWRYLPERKTINIYSDYLK